MQTNTGTLEFTIDRYDHKVNHKYVNSSIKNNMTSENNTNFRSFLQRWLDVPLTSARHRSLQPQIGQSPHKRFQLYSCGKTSLRSIYVVQFAKLNEGNASECILGIIRWNVCEEIRSIC